MPVMPAMSLSDEGPGVPSIIEKSYETHDQELREISLKIHDYAELGFKEYKSSALLADFLGHSLFSRLISENQGFKVEPEIAGLDTAFAATYSKGKGPIVSFNSVDIQ
jgi:aminobenzoyl-glutamate utilization protein B